MSADQSTGLDNPLEQVSDIEKCVKISCSAPEDNMQLVHSREEKVIGQFELLDNSSLLCDVLEKNPETDYISIETSFASSSVISLQLPDTTDNNVKSNYEMLEANKMDSNIVEENTENLQSTLQEVYLRTSNELNLNVKDNLGAHESSLQMSDAVKNVNGHNELLKTNVQILDTVRKNDKFHSVLPEDYLQTCDVADKNVEESFDTPESYLQLSDAMEKTTDYLFNRPSDYTDNNYLYKHENQSFVLDRNELEESLVPYLDIKEEIEETYDSIDPDDLSVLYQEDVTASQSLSDPDGNEPEVQWVNVETQAPSNKDIIGSTEMKKKWKFMHENFNLVKIGDRSQFSKKKKFPLVVLPKLDLSALELDECQKTCIVKDNKLYPLNTDESCSGVDIQTPVYLLQNSLHFSQSKTCKTWGNLIRDYAENRKRRFRNVVVKRKSEYDKLPSSKFLRVSYKEAKLSEYPVVDASPPNEFEYYTSDEENCMATDVLDFHYNIKEEECGRCDQYRKELDFIYDLLQKNEDNDGIDEEFSSKKEEHDSKKDEEKEVYTTSEMKKKEEFFKKIIKEKNRGFILAMKQKDEWIKQELKHYVDRVNSCSRAMEEMKYRESALKKKLKNYITLWENCKAQQEKLRKALDDQSEIFCKEGAETMRDFTKLQIKHANLEKNYDTLKNNVQILLRQHYHLISLQEQLCDQVVLETKKRQVLEEKNLQLEEAYRNIKRNEENVLAQRRFIEKFLDEKSRESEFKLKSAVSQYNRQLNTYKCTNFKLNSEIKSLRNVIKEEKQYHRVALADPSIIVQACSRNMNKYQLGFLENQLFYNSRKTSNREYINEFKEFCIKLFEQNSSAFNALREYFLLPDEDVLGSWIKEASDDKKAVTLSGKNALINGANYGLTNPFVDEEGEDGVVTEENDINPLTDFDDIISNEGNNHDEDADPSSRPCIDDYFSSEDEGVVHED